MQAQDCSDCTVPRRVGHHTEAMTNSCAQDDPVFLASNVACPPCGVMRLGATWLIRVTVFGHPSPQENPCDFGSRCRGKSVCTRTQTTLTASKILPYLSFSWAVNATSSTETQFSRAISPNNARISQSRWELDNALIISSCMSRRTSLRVTFPSLYLARFDARLIRRCS